MALNDEQLAVLKTELETDPKSLGYSQPPNINDPADAALLNEAGLSNETIGNTNVPCLTVRDQVDEDEFAAIPAGKRDLILMILGDGQVSLDITNALLVGQFMGAFTQAVAPTTRQRLIDLATRPCSRAEALFEKANIHVTHLDCAHARQL